MLPAESMFLGPGHEYWFLIMPSKNRVKSPIKRRTDIFALTGRVEKCVERIVLYEGKIWVGFYLLRISHNHIRPISTRLLAEIINPKITAS